MTPFGMVLCAGAQHSPQNAKNLRAWWLEARDGPDRVWHEIVNDYQRRNFLTKADADRLIREGAPR